MTDATILVPNGFTLDGANHTITAMDPAGDLVEFKGVHCGTVPTD